MSGRGGAAQQVSLYGFPVQAVMLPWALAARVRQGILVVLRRASASGTSTTSRAGPAGAEGQRELARLPGAKSPPLGKAARRRALTNACGCRETPRASAAARGGGGGALLRRVHPGQVPGAPCRRCDAPKACRSVGALTGQVASSTVLQPHFSAGLEFRSPGVLSGAVWNLCRPRRIFHAATRCAPSLTAR